MLKRNSSTDKPSGAVTVYFTVNSRNGVNERGQSTSVQNRSKRDKELGCKERAKRRKARQVL